MIPKLIRAEWECNSIPETHIAKTSSHFTHVIRVGRVGPSLFPTDTSLDLVFIILAGNLLSVVLLQPFGFTRTSVELQMDELRSEAQSEQAKTAKNKPCARSES
jgi:hypothetical protein